MFIVEMMKTGGAIEAYEDPNDPNDFVKIVFHYRTVCPAEQERLFCYAAEGKLLAHYIPKGMPYRVNPNKPIGKNKVCTYMKEICERAGCVPPKTGKVTNHGGRRHGINLMAQAGVRTSENMTHARHRNANVNAQYQQNTEVTRSTRVMDQRSAVVPTDSRRLGVTRMMYSPRRLEARTGSEVYARPYIIGRFPLFPPLPDQHQT
jgi:hypothetical protein